MNELLNVVEIVISKSKLMKCLVLKSHFLKMGFTPHKALQPIQGMEFKKKRKTKLENI